MSCKANNIYCLALYRESFLTIGISVKASYKIRTSKIVQLRKKGKEINFL